MADFKAAQKKVKEHEGGYTDNPKDIGNWLAVNGTKYAWAKKDKTTGQLISPIGGKLILVGTNYGVAAPTLADYYKRPVSKEEMMKLPYSTAELIFKKNFWDIPLKGDKIKDQAIAEIIYDAIIQHSPKALSKILSDSTGKVMSIPLTDAMVDILNTSNQQTLFEKIKESRKQYYLGLNNPAFEKGWLKRIASFSYTGIQKAAEAVKENPGTSAGVALLLVAGTALILKKTVFKNS